MPETCDVVVDTTEALDRVRALQRAGKRVGLTPTMGALHEGHLSLVRASIRECDASVVTIFVNPTQFGPNEDFQQYPRDLQSDLDRLNPLGVEFVFAPDTDVMYPAGATTSIAPPKVAETLEGAMRPGHFAGVCTIVCKLFQILPVDVAFFGQKDFQQCLVVQQMVADLKMPIEIDVRPIVREPDGLALSSRNRYLSGEERERALGLSQALQTAERRIEAGESDAEAVMAEMQDVLSRSQIDKVDYAVLADPLSLEIPDRVQRPIVALIAAHVGRTRLIDNRLIG